LLERARDELERLHREALRERQRAAGPKLAEHRVDLRLARLARLRQPRLEGREALELLAEGRERERLDQVLPDAEADGAAHGVDVPSRGDGDHVGQVARRAEPAADLEPTEV